MFLSFGMMLEYSFKSLKMNNVLKKAINSVLEKGFRTIDIGTEKDKILKTSEIGNKVISELERSN